MYSTNEHVQLTIIKQNFRFVNLSKCLFYKAKLVKFCFSTCSVLNLMLLLPQIIAP